MMTRSGADPPFLWDGMVSAPSRRTPSAVWQCTSSTAISNSLRSPRFSHRKRSIPLDRTRDPCHEALRREAFVLQRRLEEAAESFAPGPLGVRVEFDLAVELGRRFVLVGH